jgi:predicted aconitase with swiveling domain
MAELIQGRTIVAGEAEGALLVSATPLSFWGAYDPATGEITDRRHPLSGRIAAGCVLALPGTIGSSTTTAVLLEAVRRGTAPAAILTEEVDTFLALASIIAEEMYGRAFPVVVVTVDQLKKLEPEARLAIRPNGTLETIGKHQG